MTKSQNTKNEQHCIKQNEKSFIQKDLSLTELWQKGKIPEAWYYVKDIHNKESLDRYFKETDNFEYLEDWEVDEVLAPVPSYDEWKAKLEENAKLKEELSRESYKVSEAYCFVEELKELLKECELWFTGIVGNMNDKNVGEHNRNLPIGNFEYVFKVFSQKINQTLGEEK